MAHPEWTAERFEADRQHLHAVAFRMLGSAGEADDAVQEAWLRLNRSDAGDIQNLTGWLTTVTARVCLDMLRARTSRREEPIDSRPPDLAAVPASAGNGDPEHEVVLADSVGVALLVVLETLAPAERIAFVLHDLFDLRFEEIAPIVDRSPAAARQLASRPMTMSGASARSSPTQTPSCTPIPLRSRWERPRGTVRGRLRRLSPAEPRLPCWR